MGTKPNQGSSLAMLTDQKRDRHFIHHRERGDFTGPRRGVLGKGTMSTQLNHPATARSGPILLTVDEVAVLLRTSRKAIYAMLGRLQLPGVVRINRRVLIRQDALLDWLGQKSTPSLESR